MHGGKCRLTRGSEAFAIAGRREAQGRPLGLLGAWLAKGMYLNTKEEHDAEVAFLSYADRVSARGQLLLATNGADLAKMDREVGQGEPDEPFGLA